MANKWNIPADVERKVKERDKKCAYCGIDFENSGTNYKNKPSWEHIINDLSLTGENNIVLCCISCNASKGAKDITDWLGSSYCQKKDIRLETVSEVVKQVILQQS